MKLFTRFSLGNLEVPNRIVMAPMTRSRAIGGVPNGLMRDYYAQRATAGLIITEGTAPSPNALGYARIPGIFSADQTEAWRVVTEGVKARGGRIIAQLMHTGRIGHPANLSNGARILAPSAVRAEGTIYTDALGAVPMPEPQAMSLQDVRDARDEFVRSAQNATAAGFDGVELHGANGYLLEQFLNPHSNRRSDLYGGGVAQRSRFVLEVAEATSDAIGADRVGIRLSPYNTFNDLPVYDEEHEQYVHLARSLRGLLYVHLIVSKDERYAVTAEAVRAAFGGPVISNGGFDADGAERELAAGRADLISFGKPFIANPDLVQRIRDRAELTAPDPSTFYTPGHRGYTDYLPLSASSSAP